VSPFLALSRLGGYAAWARSDVNNFVVEKADQELELRGDHTDRVVKFDRNDMQAPIVECQHIADF
jgi:hypothetical protein